MERQRFFARENARTIRLTANDRAGGARNRDFKPSFDRFWGVWDIHGDHTALIMAGDATRVSGVRVGGFAIFPKLAA